MTPWYDIYRERMNSRYLDHVSSKYATFIEELHKVNAQVITEIGCGAGNITRILRQMAKKPQWYHLTDACPKMLSLAIENNAVSNCNFSCSDIRFMVPANCDLVHSHGLLEHFGDEEIRAIVKGMNHAAPVQVHYVPGAMYEKPSRGDERLMEPEQWKYILRDLGEVKVSTFNGGLDIILRIER